MGRLKRSPMGLDKASKRLAGLKSIRTDLVFGNGLTLGVYEEAIDSLQTKLEVYNTSLSNLDEQLALIKKAESELRDLSERVLAGVASLYGKNSDEYLKAGGTKKSERKTSKKKPSPDNP